MKILNRIAPAFALLVAAISACILSSATSVVATAAETRTGEQIYKQQCMSCHGKSGEGSKTYTHALAGDRSIKQLGKYIAKSMPEDDPGTCIGEDADKVAAYIYDAFYSRTAQARNKPPRIELSRLTVRQYRNAVADLVGSFRSPSLKWDGPTGLHGEYYKSHRSWKKEDRIIDRVDPSVQFNFGVLMPDPTKGIGHKFFIRWEGSILAPETGDYEFIVRTEHSTRLFLNDLKTPLIDRWVKSGNDKEYRETIRLLGGRTYPIRLEFSKGKQGEKDGKKDPDPPPTKASISLLWKPPQQAEEVIPGRCLSTAQSARTLVLQTPFPADDRSIGYERGSSISKAWDQATTDAAIEVANDVVEHLGELAGVKPDAADRVARIRDFCRRFTERAFRRPLTAEHAAFYVDRQFQNARNPDVAARKVVLLVLKSPRFLYRELGGGTDPFDIASRISFGLWDSIPDQPLLNAAGAGQLATREQVARQAERMVGDLRTRSKLREFFLQWLRVDQAPDISKDPKQFVGFDNGIASDLRTSLDLFLEDAVWGETSDFRRLLIGDEIYLNGRLAKYYGAQLPADAPFQKVVIDKGDRAGVLSHPYLMATFAYTATSSPIHRGVFISRSVLGRTLLPPPEAVAPLAPDLHAGLNTRERVLLQTSPKSCQMCHGMINPLGFTLEHFDAVGRYRKEEKGRPIDSTGTYQTRSGETLTFSGLRELARFLASTDETPSALVQQLFHYEVKQSIRAYGPDTLPRLRDFFTGHDYNIRKLLVEISATSALTPRDPAQKPEASGFPLARGTLTTELPAAPFAPPF